MSIADYGFAIWETFYVTVLSTAFALVLGLPLGVLLVAGDKDGVLPLPGWLMHTLNIIINILRSVPLGATRRLAAGVLGFEKISCTEPSSTTTPPSRMAT